MFGKLEVPYTNRKENQMINANDPAFPPIFEPRSVQGGSVIPAKGFTKREYFAGLAMQGVMFWDATVNEPRETGKVERLAENAVGMADALLKELEKEIK
jgi:hypothetical protein